MELDFYLAESKVDVSSVRAKWLYPANSGTTASTTRNFYGSGNDPFSLILTFNRTDPKRGTIFSNYSSGRGFAIGFTDNNELFCSSSGELHIFHNLRLGTKNCLGITRKDSTITTYQYDVLSSGLSRTESYQFSNLSNLSGVNYTFGYNQQYTAFHDISGAVGSVDQLIYLDSTISTDPLMKIFSGFQPITRLVGTGYYLENENQEKRIVGQSTGFNWQTFNYNALLNTMRFINSGLANTGYSDINASYQINFTGSTANISGILYQTTNLCNNTGSPIFYTTSTNVGNTSGEYSALNNVIFSKNSYGEYVFTHSWTVIKSGQTGYVDHDFYQTYKTGLVTGITTDVEYYSGFRMSGIVNRDTGNGYLKLEVLNSYNVLKPTGMNNLATFDIINRNYYVNGFKSGMVYYGNLSRLDPQDYGLEGDRLTPYPSVIDSYDLIYDMQEELTTAIHFTNSGVATGAFPAYGSLGFSINYRRLPFSQYYETSNLHLAHGKGFTYPSAPRVIFDNDSRFWI